jgi:alginate O-acetyltransferase complex protein AlgI
MLFNSFDFLIFMICVIFAMIFFRNKKLQFMILIIASYIFYYFSSGFLFVLLFFSSILDFYIGRKIFESRTTKVKRIFLSLSIMGNLGVLGFFKYANFSIQIANQLRDLFGFSALPMLNIILPVGISFFTFQTMSYTIDIYRGKLNPTNSFLKFMLFVAFFPQLVAGPIIRASDFFPQLKKRKIFIIPANIKLGLTYISWGLIKKVVFADSLSPFVTSIFENPVGLNSITIMIGALAFGIQIYCDFSGYTDIAIGVARLLNFKFPKNFDKPYFAHNPSNFWERWHISLSTWLRDYLYISLGGNRKGVIRTFINLMITMLLGGLWHGASWNFVVWGLYQGLLLVAYKFISSRYNFRIGKFVSILLTQYFVFLGWLIFRIRDSEYLGYSIKKYIIFDFDFSGILEFIVINKYVFTIMLVFCVIHFLSYKIKDVIRKINSLDYKIWFLYILMVILMLILLATNFNSAFIYFQF